MRGAIALPNLVHVAHCRLGGSCDVVLCMLGHEALPSFEVSAVKGLDERRWDGVVEAHIVLMH